jgi:hypothetical protein
MAEIQPNDIGLATFADVGDVANLRTNAKEVVAAINEVLANSQGTISGEQLYMEGEDNTVIGSGNIIFGNGNRVFGTGNVIVGDNHLVIGSNKTIAEGMGEVYFDWVDTSSKRIYFYIYDDDVNFHLKVGDRIVLNIYQSWCDPNWENWVEVNSGRFLTTVTEINMNNGYIVINDMPLSNNPPDDFHTVLEYSYISDFYILRE